MTCATTWLLIKLLPILHVLVVALALFAGLADVLPYVGVFSSTGPAFMAATSRGPVVAGIVLVAMLA